MFVDFLWRWHFAFLSKMSQSSWIQPMYRRAPGGVRRWTESWSGSRRRTRPSRRSPQHPAHRAPILASSSVRGILSQLLVLLILVTEATWSQAWRKVLPKIYTPSPQTIIIVFVKETTSPYVRVHVRSFKLNLHFRYNSRWFKFFYFHKRSNI